MGDPPLLLGVCQFRTICALPGVAVSAPGAEAAPNGIP